MGDVTNDDLMRFMMVDMTMVLVLVVVVVIRTDDDDNNNIEKERCAFVHRKLLVLPTHN